MEKNTKYSFFRGVVLSLFFLGIFFISIFKFGPVFQDRVQDWVILLASFLIATGVTLCCGFIYNKVALKRGWKRIHTADVLLAPLDVFWWW